MNPDPILLLSDQAISFEVATFSVDQESYQSPELPSWDVVKEHTGLNYIWIHRFMRYFSCLQWNDPSKANYQHMHDGSKCTILDILLDFVLSTATFPPVLVPGQNKRKNFYKLQDIDPVVAQQVVSFGTHINLLWFTFYY